VTWSRALIFATAAACSGSPGTKPDGNTGADGSGATDAAAVDGAACRDIDCFTCDVRVPDDQPTIAAAIQAAPQPGVVCIRPGTFTGDIVLRSLVTLQGSGPQTRIEGHLLATALERQDAMPTFVRDLTVRADRAIVSVCPPSDPGCYPSTIALTGGTLALELERVTLDGNIANELACAGLEVSGGSLLFAFRDSRCINQRGIRFNGNYQTAARRFELTVERSRFEGAPTTNDWIYDPIEFLLSAGVSCGAQQLPAGSTAKATIVNNEFFATRYEGIYLTPCLSMAAAEAAVSKMLVAHNTFVPRTGSTGDLANAVWYNAPAGYGPDFVYANNLYVGAATDPIRGAAPDQAAGNIATGTSPVVDLAAGDLHLVAGSAAIDVATPSHAPPLDKDGKPRPVDGNGDGSALPDVGAHEYVAQ
jgi:hypothetical protein